MTVVHSFDNQVSKPGTQQTANQVKENRPGISKLSQWGRKNSK